VCLFLFLFQCKKSHNLIKMANWGSVLVMVILFVLLSPGLLIQFPGNCRTIDFSDFETNDRLIMMQTLIFFELSLIGTSIVIIPYHRQLSNIPIFLFPYSAIVNDLMGLFQPDQRSNLRLIVRVYGLEELYYVFQRSSYHLLSLGSFLPSQISISLHFDHSRNLGVLMDIIIALRLSF
jgi:hypothetical protein